MGDRLTDQRWPEKLVAQLIPSARREEVLGDLHECHATWGRYVRTVMLVLASRIRRTSDGNVLALCGAVLYFSFFAAAWLTTRQLIYADGGPWRLAIPCAAALLAMVLNDAYADPTRTQFTRLRGPMVAIAAALASQGVLWVAGSWLVLPGEIALRGGASGLVWTLLIRFAFHPPSPSRRGRA